MRITILSYTILSYYHTTGSQLATRILTFFLNVLIARSLSVDAYGVSAVQFHLINSSIVFLAREGVRRSCLRTGNADDKQLLSGSFVAIPAGALLSGLSAVYFHRSGNGAAVLQCVAAFVEILSEPLYILATSKMWFGMRTGCEAAAMIAKNLVSVWLLQSSLFSSWMDPVMAVSWGQLVYSVVLLASFWAGMWCLHSIELKAFPSLRSLTPSGDFFPMYRTFTLQALGKLVLAEGSKAVLALVTTPAVQGVYGLVNNLGSLVVRTLFQPFEEVVFVSFSKHAEKSISERAKLLTGLCQVVGIVGGVVACFGPSYSYVALRILYGERWASSEAPRALGLYSVYVALLAMNGTLEAFLHGVADKKNLLKNNVALILASVAHVAISVAAVNIHGAVGLLFADGINMLLRIAYSCTFVHSYFRSIGGMRGVRVLPSGRFLAILAVAAALANASQAALLDEKALDLPWSLSIRMLLHVVVGAFLLVAVLGVAFLDVRRGKQLALVGRGRVSDKSEKKNE
jgi:oligosaccharide translocation protein RFT1